MRQIVLDTETTGLEYREGHRIIEIGCVEIIDRRVTGNNFHQYLQPDRVIDAGAASVHGITNEFLHDKPRFADIAREFIDFIADAELIIHNAPFDLGFLDNELRLFGKGPGKIAELCRVIDTLEMARKLHPGQRNSLDALCRRYEIDNSHRQLHGALLDSEILADVYLAMTGGQVSLSLDPLPETARVVRDQPSVKRLAVSRPALKVVRAGAAELEQHALRLAAIDKASGGSCIWIREKEGPIG